VAFLPHRIKSRSTQQPSIVHDPSLNIVAWGRWAVSLSANLFLRFSYNVAGVHYRNCNFAVNSRDVSWLAGISWIEPTRSFGRPADKKLNAGRQDRKSRRPASAEQSTLSISRITGYDKKFLAKQRPGPHRALPNLQRDFAM
jgi:hypothetical protein